MQDICESYVYPTTGFTCPYPQCGLRFKDQRTIRKHYKHHKASATIIKCKICPDLFVDTLELQVHLTACHKDASLDTPSQSLKRRKVANPVLKGTSAAEEKTKYLLHQQINSVAVLYDQQLNDVECHEAELLQELVGCSAALDQALRFITHASGGSIKIPIDLQLTAHKYAGSASCLHTPPV